MATIVTKNSSTAGAAPVAANLVKGELAVNVTDQILYTENNAGSVVRVSPPMRLINTASPTSGATVNFSLPAYSCSKLVLVFDTITSLSSSNWSISFQSGTGTTFFNGSSVTGVIDVYNTNVTGNKLINARIGTAGFNGINTSMTGVATAINITTTSTFSGGKIYLYGID